MDSGLNINNELMKNQIELKTTSLNCIPYTKKNKEKPNMEEIII